jgi:hypothetical protein
MFRLADLMDIPGELLITEACKEWDELMEEFEKLEETRDHKVLTDDQSDLKDKYFYLYMKIGKKFDEWEIMKKGVDEKYPGYAKDFPVDFITILLFASRTMRAISKVLHSEED